MAMSLRRAECVGRPLGSDGFLDGLEKRLGAAVRAQKRGPKQKPAEDPQPDGAVQNSVTALQFQ